MILIIKISQNTFFKNKFILGNNILLYLLYIFLKHFLYISLSFDNEIYILFGINVCSNNDNIYLSIKYYYISKYIYNILGDY